MKRMVNVIVIFLLTGISSIAIAEVYKWVDEQGRTHYGEKPAGDNASPVQIKDAPQVNEPVKEPVVDQEKLLQIYEEERSIKKEEKLKAEQEKADRKERCGKLEKDLNDMKHGGYVFYELDENGEPVFKSDTEVDERIKNLQKQYDKEC